MRTLRPPLQITPALALAALTALGCMGKIAPQSAQAGSTVVIPLGARNQVGAVGFGGSDVQDPQRGELVYTLDTPSGPFELPNRGSALVTTNAASKIARGNLFVHQIVSVLDIPAGAPHGTHPIDVVWRRTDPGTGSPVETPVPYGGELSVLPNTIDVTGPNGPETIQGQITPFERGDCGGGSCSFTPLTPSQLASAIPDPTIRLQIDQPVWAVEIELVYPPAVIDVVDAFEARLFDLNHRAATWFQTDGSGTATVSASATVESFQQLNVAFTLDDPATAILDPANDLSVSVLRAWDRDGNAIAASAAINGVF